MKRLEERIRQEGIVKSGSVLKVDGFINHQMDVQFFDEMGAEFKRLYQDRPINKILTIEASGIGIAIIAGLHFGVPVVFAKKSRSSNISDEVYHTLIHSYTHGNDNTVIVPAVSRPGGSPAHHRRFPCQRLRPGGPDRSGPSGRRHGGGHRHCGGKGLPEGRRPAAQPGLPHRITGHHRIDGRRDRGDRLPGAVGEGCLALPRQPQTGQTKPRPAECIVQQGGAVSLL